MNQLGEKLVQLLIGFVAFVVAITITSQLAGLITDTNILIGLWIVLAGPIWAIIGTVAVPRRYRILGLDDSQASTLGALGGFVAGPVALWYIWQNTPPLTRNWGLGLAALAAWVLYTIFALIYPDNLCVRYPAHYTFISQQLVNGITIGAIYALMAVGLTLIYSVQGIVSFAHGQFYMIGGYISYYTLIVIANAIGWDVADVNPLLGIPVAAVVTFIIGALFERLLLRPMHTGKIERISEYAILITFGFGFFVEYATLGLAGPLPQRAGRFIETRRFPLNRFSITEDLYFGPINVIGDRAVSMAIGVVLILALLLFLNKTWTGRALRAVSMDKQAAAVTGINPLDINTLSFGMGSMLAAMSGAALIPIFAWVPWIGAEMAGRSYVIVVLGGLGSVPGALVGGVIVGIVESIGSGCFPDPSRGAAYKEAFALLIFALILLMKPTGLFGREQL